MRAAWQALQIMWTIHNDHSSGEKSSKSYTLKVGEQRFDTDVYEPHVKCKGTIVVIHGMSPFGKDDKRIVMFCQALCHVGFRVVAPDIQTIRQLKIDAAQILTITKLLGLIANNNKYAPQGRISVLAPSFSGGMCLAAAADPDLQDKIISVCAIGAFTHVDSVMDYLLTSAEADPYGRYIVLKKIIPMVMKGDLIENCELIQQALDAAIEDNINETTLTELDRKVPLGSCIALNKCIDAMSDPERTLVEKILNDSEFRKDLFSSARTTMSDELSKLNIVGKLDQLTAKVLLLHGKEDKVIPYSQSELLHKRLQALKKQSDLVVTPFISHGDTSITMTMVYDIVKIIKGFSFFFEDLKHAECR